METLIQSVNESLSFLRSINPGEENLDTSSTDRPHKLKKVLVANRGEIAKRFFLALKEEGIPSVAIVTDVDMGQSWYQQADEVVFIGDGKNYTNISIVLAASILVNANGIYPGYGFLSENADFVESIDSINSTLNKQIIFMGPSAKIMRKVGDKLAARALAKEQGVPLFEGSESIQGLDEAKQIAGSIGYPVLIKLSAGGGGKGMIPVFAESELEFGIESSQRTGKNLYGDDTFYLEKFIEQPVHMEVQIFNGTAIGLRKCAVQRRNQKVLEETGDAFLDSHMILSMLAAAENMARISGYSDGAGAGTVEFLYDVKSQKFGFLEMNVRLQVEHPVTDQSLKIDLAKWQILYFDGRDDEIPYSQTLEQRFTNDTHAIEARIYAEDPENDYAPAPGIIQELDLPTFNGIRCDFGFKEGDSILPDYDPMIGKIIVFGNTRREAITRLERALSELYIQGVLTNINQLLAICRNDEFIQGDYTNLILQKNPDLEISVPDNATLQKAAVFAALGEHTRLLNQNARQSLHSPDLENTVQRLSINLTSNSYSVKVYEHDYIVELLQTSLEAYYVYLNGTFLGEVELLPRLEGDHDFLVRFGLHSYPIRMDQRSSFTVLRMNDEHGKIRYLRMQVASIGSGDTSDPLGMVRAPFQSTFVALSPTKADKKVLISVGERVEKDDPIMIISAMKMETTIKAGISGKLSYILEDGDLNRLQLGKTADGLIIGKSISEGEVLFVIEQENEVETDTAASLESQQATEEIVTFLQNRPSILIHLFNENLHDVIQKTPGESVPIILQLLKGHFLGFPLSPIVLERLSTALSHIDEKALKEINQKFLQDEINSMLEFYLYIKQIYSSNLINNSSYFAELNQFVLNWQKDTFQPSNAFRLTLGNLFRSYRITDWIHKPASEKSEVQLAFFGILRAHNSCLNHAYIINNLIQILVHAPKLQRRISYTLKKLIFIEQSELDDYLADSAITVLQSTPYPRLSRDAIPWVSMKHMREYRRMINNVFSSFEIKGEDENSIREKFSKSLQAKSEDFFGKELHPNLRAELEPKLTVLGRKYEIQTLYSPASNIAIYKLTEKESQNKSSFLAYGYVESFSLDFDEQKAIVGSKEFDRVCIESTRVLRAYQSLEELSGNRVEIFVTSKSLEIDMGSADPGTMNYFTFRRFGMNVLRFFTHTNIYYSLFHVNKHLDDGSFERKMIKMSLERGKLLIDLLQDDDARNPYSVSAADDRTQKMYFREKWPANIWAKEAFDDGKYNEIFIKSIDEVSWTNPKTGKEGFKPVGSKIYMGEIGGHEAIFYIKDSRIAGGATGDLEGQKYVAASYIAYLRGIPLYTWNDGAGANIREGMVSLNRAGEGFLMNALLGGRVNAKTFYRHTRFNPDIRLQQLFTELDEQFNLDNSPLLREDRNVLTVAVGIGSSTGLDVYGSSQSAIQVIVDADESYRVLTGSNVIKSVTGEDLTNYEIGGAGVMSKWTGTVDFVAQDKLHLLTYIRRIQETFVQTEKEPAIRRDKLKNDTNTPSDQNKEVVFLSERMILQNVDKGSYIPFKENWYGASNLLGGFAKLGGHRTLIIGPRSHFGLRTFAAITKAKELVRAAHKTGAHQILIFGKNWYYETVSENENAMRARLDFMKEIHKKKGVRVHIITHQEGLHRVKINTMADALVFVKTADLNAEDMEKAKHMAAFIVDSMEEAFDLSVKIIDLLSKRDCEAREPDASQLGIPEDPVQPYDIISSVIEPVFDPDTFIEFYADMNKASGPGLITGFARLDGKSVAIIADQPTIMGGAPDAPGTEKYRIFTELIDRNKIPLVMLNNAPGFVPGVKQERLRIQQIGGESLDVNILSNMPVVSVILNQNYGGRQIHAFSKFIRPGIVYIALKNAVMAVMGAKASFDLFMGTQYNALIAESKEQEAGEMRLKYVNDYNTKAAAHNDAFQTGILDWLVNDIKTLRAHLVQGMKIAEVRASEILDYECSHSFPVEEAPHALLEILRLNNIEGNLTSDGKLIIHTDGKQKEVQNEAIEAFILGYGNIGAFQN